MRWLQAYALVATLLLLCACVWDCCDARSHQRRQDGQGGAGRNVRDRNANADHAAYAQDARYRQETRKVLENVGRRQRELAEDKHDLLNTRPTGKFSYDGHVQALDNEKRHLENVKAEHSECQRSGRCK
eukprot:Opistho-2@27779